MVQDMAVPHVPAADIEQGLYPNDHVTGDVNRILGARFAGQWPRRRSPARDLAERRAVDDLELHLMDVDGVIPAVEVMDLPDLHVTELRTLCDGVIPSTAVLSAATLPSVTSAGLRHRWGYLLTKSAVGS
jgi:hypothetical protein